MADGRDLRMGRCGYGQMCVWDHFTQVCGFNWINVCKVNKPNWGLSHLQVATRLMLLEEGYLGKIRQSRDCIAWDIEYGGIGSSRHIGVSSFLSLVILYCWSGNTGNKQKDVQEVWKRACLAERVLAVFICGHQHSPLTSITSTSYHFTRSRLISHALLALWWY